MGIARLYCPRYITMADTHRLSATGSVRRVEHDRAIRVQDSGEKWATGTIPVSHQDGGEKSATGGERSSIRNRLSLHRGNTITTGTWNVRTLNQTGKLKELTHEMERYKWHILGLCETRWKDFRELLTEGHTLYYSGDQTKHIHGVGFLAHKDIRNSIMGCNTISSRLASIRLCATPFNLTIIQVYATTTDHSEEEIEDFYNEL